MVSDDESRMAEEEGHLYQLLLETSEGRREEEDGCRNVKASYELRFKSLLQLFLR